MECDGIVMAGLLVGVPPPFFSSLVRHDQIGSSDLPSKSRTAWLEEKISAALTQPLNGHILSIVDQGEQGRIGWWGLVQCPVQPIR